MCFAPEMGNGNEQDVTQLVQGTGTCSPPACKTQELGIGAKGWLEARSSWQGAGWGGNHPSPGGGNWEGARAEPIRVVLGAEMPGSGLGLG